MASPNPKIASTPKGFRSITASIAVSDVTAAISFYTKVLHGEMTESLAAPDNGMLLYAQVKIAGTTILLTLDKAALPSASTGHLSLHHYVDALEKTYKTAIDAGAVVIFPITETWWGDLNAVLIDPFGVRWSLAKRVERLSAGEREQRFLALYVADTPPKTSSEPNEQEIANDAETARKLSDIELG